MRTAGIQFEWIDDCLGQAAKRYFGEGFKKVTQQVTDVSVGLADGTGFVHAKASLDYPADWSQKSDGVMLQPHMSSVDVLLIGIQLCELYLTHAYSLGPAQRRKMWLRRFTMRAGPHAQLDLTNIDTRACHIQVRTAPDTLCGHVSIFDCVIGTMKIRCEIEHELSPVTVPTGFYRHADEILGPARQRYYGEGYKRRNQMISCLDVDLDQQRVEAAVEISEPHDDGEGGDGLGAYYGSSLTVIDCLINLAQIAQVLIHQVDGVERSRSNTLWMRKLSVACDTPIQPAPTSFTASARVFKSNLLNLAGRTGRSQAALAPQRSGRVDAYRTLANVRTIRRGRRAFGAGRSLARCPRQRAGHSLRADRGARAVSARVGRTGEGSGG